MRYYGLFLVAALLLSSSLAFAAGPPSAKAGKYTVELSSQPSPPVVGANLLVITVKDGETPVAGAGVAVHVDMTSMPMPADVKAAPGTKDGEYGATVNLGMAGTWQVDVAVQQMAGMKMDGDGAAHFVVATGKGITAKDRGVAIPWFAVFVVFIIAATIVTIPLYTRMPVHQRGYLVGTLTLLIVLVGTIAVVKKYRDPKTSTVIASANMDMSAQAAPGTVAVAAETIHPTTFQASASYTGTVVPDQEEDVYPRVTGRLILMPFYPGDRIAPGQLVARLDSRELLTKEQQAAYGSAAANQGITAANADVASARAAQRKAQRSRQQTAAQLTQAQAAVRSAESAVQSAQSGVEQANEAVVQAQSEVDTAQAEMTYWTAEIAREQKLYTQGAIAKEELDRETSQAAAAQAKLKQVQAGVRTAQVGVTRAKQDQARAEADRDSANGRVAEVQAAVLAAESDIQAAQAATTGASAKAGMANAAAGQARAQLSEASTVKGYTEIRASYGGVVTARNISPGTLVQPGMSMMKIAKTDVVRIQVNVSEADLSQVTVGQTMLAHTIDAPNQPLAARISAVFPAQDPSARTAIVEARVPNTGGRLRPGQYLAIELRLGSNQRPALSVPTSALIARDNQASVFVVASDGLRTTAKREIVTTGRVSNARTEILTGLKDGDQVITSGLANLHDGDAVTVLQQGAASSSMGDDAAAPPVPPRAEATGLSETKDAGMLPAPSPAATHTSTPPKHTSMTAMSMPGSARGMAHKADTAKTGQPTDNATKWYHCPMHVDMESTKPGKCPKCGMDYVPFEKK
ncbi:MAG TPA: efflux RND transporter periplasmic adaptor subunit [Armatimonadota bacterium]|jgi:RND family efflux transporter MFP subunit